jgi:hypothetical protein
MMRKASLMASLMLVLVGVGTVFGQGTGDYIKFQPGATPNDGELKIAVESWRTPSGVIVDLYGVVHIADQSYYQQVQRELNGYDAVLYEGVGATKEALAAKRANKDKGSASGLSSIQTLFGKVLGLQFQMDGIAYTHSNLVHADMGAGQFQRETKGQKINPLEQYVSPEQLKALEPLLKMGGQLLELWMKSNPDMQNSLKVRFGSQMATTDMTTQLPPQMYKTIVIDRNAIVMRVLAEQLRDHPNKKRIAIFYGAAHNPDFAQRFSKLGYTKVSTRWLTAWHIGRGATPQSEKKGAEAPKKAPERAPAKSY